MLVTILSHNNIEVTVDAEDVELVSQYSWTAYKDGYAKKYIEKTIDGKRHRRVIYMHRLIMDAKENEIVDHRDGNRLNNSKSNLRIVSKSLNCLNTRKHRNVHGYKGVVSTGRDNLPYTATIRHNKVRLNLGSYRTAKEAGEAYLAKWEELTA